MEQPEHPRYFTVLANHVEFGGEYYLTIEPDKFEPLGRKYDFRGTRTKATLFASEEQAEYEKAKWIACSTSWRNRYTNLRVVEDVIDDALRLEYWVLYLTAKDRQDFSNHVMRVCGVGDHGDIVEFIDPRIREYRRKRCVGSSQKVL